LSKIILVQLQFDAKVVPVWPSFVDVEMLEKLVAKLLIQPMSDVVPVATTSAHRILWLSRFGLILVQSESGEDGAVGYMSLVFPTSSTPNWTYGKRAQITSC
jgi:hypothetical protein